MITPRLHCGIVLRSEEDACQVVAGGTITSVRYAPQFPAPRRERVLPGHLVAIAETGETGETGETDGNAVVVWRWYDAVVAPTGGSLAKPQTSQRTPTSS